MTADLEKKLEELEEKPESIRKKVGNTAMETRVQKMLETIVKLLKDVKESIENSMKDVEAEEMELGKERDEMDDRKKMPEERKKSFEKSTDGNNNTVLNDTGCCEKELVADRTPNALEPDDSPLGRQKNARFLDRAASPVKQMRSKLEGKFSMRVILGTICLRRSGALLM